MKKILLSLIVLVAIVGIGFSAYKNHSKNASNAAAVAESQRQEEENEIPPQPTYLSYESLVQELSGVGYVAQKAEQPDTRFEKPEFQNCSTELPIRCTVVFEKTTTKEIYRKTISLEQAVEGNETGAPVGSFIIVGSVDETAPLK